MKSDKCFAHYSSMRKLYFGIFLFFEKNTSSKKDLENSVQRLDYLDEFMILEVFFCIKVSTITFRKKNLVFSENMKSTRE